MCDRTKTERLREMLTERDVAWKPGYSTIGMDNCVTEFEVDGVVWQVIERQSGSLWVSAIQAVESPERVISALVDKAV